MELVAHPHYLTTFTADSNKSHTSLSAEETLQQIRDNFHLAKPSPSSDGVLLIPLSNEHMFTGIVLLQEGDTISGVYRRRRPVEDPRKITYSGEHNKMPSVESFAIVYPSTLLEEDDDNTLDPVEGNWELVALNNSPVAGGAPIDPDTLMHNQFGSSGGTATGLSDEQFVAELRSSFHYYLDKVKCAPAS